MDEQSKRLLYSRMLSGRTPSLFGDALNPVGFSQGTINALRPVPGQPGWRGDISRALGEGPGGQLADAVVSLTPVDSAAYVRDAIAGDVSPAMLPLVALTAGMGFGRFLRPTKLPLMDELDKIRPHDVLKPAVEEAWQSGDAAKMSKAYAAAAPTTPTEFKGVIYDPIKRRFSGRLPEQVAERTIVQGPALSPYKIELFSDETFPISQLSEVLPEQVGSARVLGTTEPSIVSAKDSYQRSFGMPSSHLLQASHPLFVQGMLAGQRDAIDLANYMADTGKSLEQASAALGINKASLTAATEHLPGLGYLLSRLSPSSGFGVSPFKNQYGATGWGAPLLEDASKLGFQQFLPAMQELPLAIRLNADLALGELSHIAAHELGHAASIRSNFPEALGPYSPTVLPAGAVVKDSQVGPKVRIPQELEATLLENMQQMSPGMYQRAAELYDVPPYISNFLSRPNSDPALWATDLAENQAEMISRAILDPNWLAKNPHAANYFWQIFDSPAVRKIVAPALIGTALGGEYFNANK